MGSADSKQKLGERVMAARKKLEEDKKVLLSRTETIELRSPGMTKVIVQSISDSFKSCSPFLEPTLLVAFQSNPKAVQQIVIESCQKVLSAPIVKEEYEWFRQYVFNSSIWMFKTKRGRFMYQELMDIANTMSHDIINSMDSIYEHLEKHPKWGKVLDIKNKTIVSRQDHKKVGLLQDIKEYKEDDDKEHDDDTRTFIDSNLGINILTNTAKNINQEFQDHIKVVMSHCGDFKEGPTKKVGRCLSKLENDYQHAAYPKAAKLLDLVRCSVSFNTVDQLVAGHKALVAHIQKKGSPLELARVKNGFIDKLYDGGYRDIKLNVIYHSDINVGQSMVCEVQLMLHQYLHEKKRIHKLYSIVREEIYFEMIVKNEETTSSPKDLKDLQFKEVVNVGRDTSLSKDSVGWVAKSSMDSDLGLLAIEGMGGFAVVDIKEKKPIFTLKQEYTKHEKNDGVSFQTNQWLTINTEKYISVQTKCNEIKMFKVPKKNNVNYKFVEEEKYKINTRGIINFCDMDRKFENIVLVTDRTMLQKRSISNIKNISHSIRLKEAVKPSWGRNLRISGNGTLVGLASGGGKRCFQVIDIENNQQNKITTWYLDSTYGPCFINGENKWISFGDVGGRAEIFDIEKKQSIKRLVVLVGGNNYVIASASTNNVLALGSSCGKTLKMYDVRNWECFYEKKFSYMIQGLHLTEDLKYITLAASGSSDTTVVLQVE